MLFRIYGCLIAHGKYIFRKCFSVDLCWGVNWFPFLFYLQIPFSGKQRESWVRGRSRPRAERERERERGRRDRTQKPTPTNPENPRPSSFVASIAPLARSSYPSTDRSRRTSKPIVLVAPQNRSFSSHLKTDRPQPKFVVPDRDLAFAPIAIAALRRVISPSPPPRDLASRRTQSPLSLPSSLKLIFN